MCTTVIVGRLASATGRVILGHNEDSGGRCMHQQFWVPGGKHAAGEFVVGEPGRAKVPQAPETLGYYWSNMLAPAPGSSFDQGLANEAGVVFCSNSGGDSFDGALSDEETNLKDGGIGFLLRRCVMERAKSAREAVEIAAKLLTEYGYWSPARNYSFADAKEAWILNVVKGKHFVAKRVPDDKVMLISNYLAIRSVDLSDKENVVASPDLIEYAVRMGRYAPKVPGDYSDFDFSAAYQPESVRLDRNKSVRMRTGWQAITGTVFGDPRNYPELQTPKAPMDVEAVKAVLRLTAEETYRNRGDGKADAFHASAEDISRSHTRESWVAEVADDPLFTVLWRTSANQDASPYVPWFPIAQTVPQGYQWMTLEEARKAHFNMPAKALDFDLARSWYIYACLGELANFDRSLMAGIWPVRDKLEAQFKDEVAAVRERAASASREEARELLGEFTAKACARADEIYLKLWKEFSDEASTPCSAKVEAEAVKTGSPDELVAIDLYFGDLEGRKLALDPKSVRWSLGFTGKKDSVLHPATPVSAEKCGSLKWRLKFRAEEVAKYAVPGCRMDTYVRGFFGHRRFVAPVIVTFEA